MGRALSFLDEAGIRVGAEALASVDPRLSRLYAANGAPPLWGREPGFATLVKIVLEQQVSLDSAAAAFANLAASLGDVTPAAFLTLNAPDLKTIGFSRQKAGYCAGIAAGILDVGIIVGET